jgi:glucuronate isomerase
MIPLSLHPDRLFSSDPAQRDLSRALYATIKQLPILSPHGHTDPQWYADNASALLITPDHYVFRMLYSQGVKLEDLAIPRRDGGPVEQDARKIWRTFATNYRLFRGTPTRVWLDHAFQEVFGVRERLTPESADRLFDQINDCLAKPEFRPRALFERFNIEVIATTESPLDPLAHHAPPRQRRRCVVTGTVRIDRDPIEVLPPTWKSRAARRRRQPTWRGYLAAHRNGGRLQDHGATSTDHGHRLRRPRPVTRNARLVDRGADGRATASEAEAFAERDRDGENGPRTVW